MLQSGTMTFALIAIVMAVAATEESYQLDGDGTELLDLSSFTAVDRAGHLSYLFAKRHAVKNADAAKLKGAQEKCNEDRAVAFQHCGAKFCQCQGSGSSCGTLELAEFLETPPSMLSQAGKTCNMAALKGECALVVGDAYHSCRNAFLASKPVSTKALLMAKDTSEFINLAAQFTTDRNSVSNFAEFLKQDLLETGKNSTNSSKPTVVPESKGMEEEDHYARMAKHFGRVEHNEWTVKRDLHEAKIMGEPLKKVLPLYSSLHKCRDLKRNTYMQCGKLMCHYVQTCGSKVQMTQCAREAAEDASERKTKEIMYKHRKAVAYALFKHNQEVAAKAPELKAKANTKEKVWKRGAPERNAKEAHKKKVMKETAEIRGKADAQVAKWLPNHDGEEYVCDGITNACKWVKKKKAKKTSRRLLSTAREDVTMADEVEVDYILNAKVMMERITKKQKNAEAKVRKQEKYMKAIAKLQASPACKASAHTAFGKCHQLTVTAYDVCINVYDKASRNYTASHPTLDFVQIRETIREEKRTRRNVMASRVTAAPKAKKSLYQEQTELFEDELNDVRMGEDKILQEDAADDIVPEA